MSRYDIKRDASFKSTAGSSALGTNSGHSHNTLIQSIITLILGYENLMDLFPELDDDWFRKNVWIESLGDDNVTGLNGEPATLSCDDYADPMFTKFGIDRKWK